jgi:sugar phosphate isomerase/epimerase
MRATRQVARREFLKESVFGAAVLTALGLRRAAASPPAALEKQKIKIGGCDWSLEKEGDPGSFAVARKAGLEGVEVSCGKGEEKLPISDVKFQERLLAEARKNELPIPSTCLEILHRDGLKDHPRAPRWVEEAIGPTRALGGRVILLPFFGKRSINQRSEQKAVAERLKPIAPAAEKAGVVLGLENTISAEDNAWILEQIGSPAVKVYYDVGNSSSNHFDIYREVAWLGKDRLAQIHLKDRNALLGDGTIDFPRLVESILKSGFEGWCMLETAVVGTVEESFKRNAGYIRKLLAEKVGKV